MMRIVLAVPGLALAALLTAGAALADDTVTRAVPTPHQAMKACIDKQKTADVTMSKAEMTRICKDELKREKKAGETTPPPRDQPNP
jgi:hypothetical protein